MADKLWQCECGAYFRESAMLSSPNPFAPDETLYFCPECKDVTGDPMREICDEPGCTSTATSGWPHPDGYRRTCYVHSEHAKHKEAQG